MYPAIATTMNPSIKTPIAIIVGLGALTLAVTAQDQPALESQKDKVSYAIGLSVGTSLQRQGFEVDPDILSRAMRDVLDGKEPAMTEADARQVLQAYNDERAQKMEAERAAQAAKNKEAGAAWLAENAKKEGVIVTDSGLQYKVLTEGSGKAVTQSDTVTVNYHGTLIDGTVFDSSVDRGQPATFRVTGVIPGWTEALLKMKVGDKWQLYIPSDLAYGDRAMGDKIKPGSTLIFEVELVDTVSPQPITSDIIKVPSAEEMKKGAQIETIKAEDVERLRKEAEAAKQAEGNK